jgi:hypothetical protein
LSGWDGLVVDDDNERVEGRFNEDNVVDFLLMMIYDTRSA